MICTNARNGAPCMAYMPARISMTTASRTAQCTASLVMTMPSAAATATMAITHQAATSVLLAALPASTIEWAIMRLRLRRYHQRRCRPRRGCGRACSAGQWAERRRMWDRGGSSPARRRRAASGAAAPPYPGAAARAGFPWSTRGPLFGHRQRRGGAGFDTQAAQDAPQVVDLIDRAVPLARRVPLGLGIAAALDVDGVGWAGPGTELAADALFQAIGAAVELVPAMEPRRGRLLLLRVLDGVHLAELLPEGDPEPLDRVQEIKHRWPP